ncbi:hypothetical protein LTS10_007871 [Elasticomyces elasticus]|nr:hypothetical protein LTS10_007871 [Elasticomyces elasticus]
MDTYDSVGWCSAPEQKGWCPDLIRQQISDIAAHVLEDATIYKIDEEMYKIDEKPYLVREMSKSSGRAAVLAMSWAAIAMTGGKTLGQNASDHLAWSLDHLDKLNRGHTEVDSDKLRKAMKARTPGTPAAGSRVEWPYYVEGVMTPSYMLGPLMGSPGPCLDPFLCSPATYAAINPLLVGMMSEGVLPKEDWLLFLLESASHKGLVKRGGKGKGPAEGGQWSSQYYHRFFSGKWLERPGYSGEGHQVPPDGFEASKPYTDDAANSPADFDSNDLVRAEEYHHETNTMQNRVLRPDPPARESVTTSPETQTFREVGTDGKPIGPSKTLNKGSVKKLIQQFEDLGKGNDLKLLTKDGKALKNSLGEPLIGKATKEGNVVELETLEPIGQTIRTDTGNMVRKFSMYDRDGRHTKTDVWEDDAAHSLKNFIRLTEGIKSTWPTIEELPEGDPNSTGEAPPANPLTDTTPQHPQPGQDLPPQPIEDPSPPGSPSPPSESGNFNPDDPGSHNSENPPPAPDGPLPANSPIPRPRPIPGDPFPPYQEPEEFRPPPSEDKPPGSEDSGYDGGSESSSRPPTPQNPDRIPPSPPESIPPSLPPSEPPSEPMTNPPTGPGGVPVPVPFPVILPFGDSHSSSSSSTSSTSPSSMATTGSQVKTVSSATTTGESSAHSSTSSSGTATTASGDKTVSSPTTTGTSSAHSTSASSQSTSAVSTATPTSVLTLSKTSVEVVTKTSSVRPVSTVVTMISTVRPVTAVTSLFRPTAGPYSNGTAVVLTKTWASTGVMTFQTVTRSAAASAA